MFRRKFPSPPKTPSPFNDCLGAQPLRIRIFTKVLVYCLVEMKTKGLGKIQRLGGEGEIPTVIFSLLTFAHT